MKTQVEKLSDFDDVYIKYLQAQRSALEAELKLAYAMLEISREQLKELESK